MVDDLLSNNQLIGQSKKEVITLLGKDDGEYFKDEDNFVYYLGNERGLISIDSEWLVITFDEGEKVSEYEILTD